MRVVYAFTVLVALVVTVFPAVARAQDAEASAPVELTLAKALEARVTVWRQPGGRAVYVSHCRAFLRGCRSRIAAFAHSIARVARERALDPFVLAAMAVRESGLDPFVRGPAGEMGIVQLHPRGIGARVRFVRSEPYRRSCRRLPGACQDEVLEVGADHLADAIARCGTLEAGLGAYNSGVCGDTSYTRRVMREHARLVELAKTDALPPALRHVD